MEKYPKVILFLLFWVSLGFCLIVMALGSCGWFGREKVGKEEIEREEETIGTEA